MVQSGLVKNIAYKVLPASFWRRRWRSAFERYWSTATDRPLLEALAASDRLAIDIGAAEGIMTHLFAKHFKHVESFEPNPEQLRKLHLTAPSNVNVHDCALGNRVGTANLHVPHSDSERLNSWGSLRSSVLATTDEATVYEVQAARLDDFRFEGVALIKIDVEGWEDEVLAGAVGTIQRDHPAMYIEIEQRHRTTPIGAVVDNLAAMGYSAYFLQRNQLCLYEEFDESRHQSDRCPADEYANNFLFVHESTLDHTLWELASRLHVPSLNA